MLQVTEALHKLRHVSQLVVLDGVPTYMTCHGSRVNSYFCSTMFQYMFVQHTKDMYEFGIT